MKISEPLKEDMARLIAEAGCDKKCECFANGMDQAPDIRSFAGGRLVECLKSSRCPCGSKLYFGNTAFCKCPVALKVTRLLKL